jgi:hypothetical protein
VGLVSGISSERFELDADKRTALWMDGSGPSSIPSPNTEAPLPAGAEASTEGGAQASTEGGAQARTEAGAQALSPADSPPPFGV